MRKIILGIDLGTTNSVASVFQADKTVKVIPNPEGTNTTPSIVAFKSNGEVIIGNAAKRQLALNPDNTVVSIKRKMGTSEKVNINGKYYTPEEISAKILSYIKDYSEKSVGQKIEDAVVTVPAYFNDAQRQATKNACKIAGLNVSRIINEPTAAAIAYGLDSKKEGKILVFDLGGGTFDVSILEICDGTFEVVSTSGDNKLGGDDWDIELANYLESELKKENPSVSITKAIKVRLIEAAEKAKINLSNSLETEVTIPFIASTANGPISLDTKISRAKFEDITKHLLDRCIIPVENALKDAKLTINEINEIILVGGSTRMPAVQNMIKNTFKKTPNLSVNPDEVVSRGAAIQGGILTGEMKDVVLLDVTPLTLGIETLGGVMTPLITRNTTIPTTKSQIFSTAEDNQPAVDIVIYQGERPMAKDNKLLGRFQLTGIKPARRGEPRIEVTFNIDVNGIFNVKAKDLDTQREQSIEIKNSSGLSQSEIERMIKEANENKEADNKRKENVEIKNKAEQYLFMIEKSLKENSDKINPDQKSKIEKLRNEINELISKEDYDGLKNRINELEQAVSMMSSMQQQNQNNANATSNNTENGNSSQQKNDDNVVDADFTDKSKK